MKYKQTSQGYSKAQWATYNRFKKQNQKESYTKIRFGESGYEDNDIIDGHHGSN